MQDGVYDAFVGKLAERLASLSVGYGMDDVIDVGPLIDRSAFTKVEEHLADAVAKVATVLAGGKPA